MDYTPFSETATVPAGQLGKYVFVTACGDCIAEPTETILMRMSNPVNGTIAASDGTIRIFDDEPRLSIGSTTVADGCPGCAIHALFPVRLSMRYDQEVRASYTTSNGTATAPSDYTATTGTVIFPAGTTTVNARVVVRGDALNEPNETFFVTLASPTANALITTPRATGTIVSEDVDPVGKVSVTPRRASAAAGDTISYAVKWTHPNRWRDLQDVDLRFVDSRGGVAFRVRFDEATNSLSVYNRSTGRFEGAATPGSNVRLDNANAALDVARSSVVGSGPTGPSVQLRLPIIFKTKAAGRPYRVDVLARDDTGQTQIESAIARVTVNFPRVPSVLVIDRGQRFFTEMSGTGQVRASAGHLQRLPAAAIQCAGVGRPGQPR